MFFCFAPSSALAALSVDIKADNQDSLTLSTSTQPFTVSLTTVDAIACQLTAPTSSGLSPSASFTVLPGDASYPAIGGSTTFSVTCIDAGGASLSDSVIVILPAPITPPTIDVKVNGSDGPVTLSSGSTYTYTWNSTNSTACQQVSPTVSGVTLNGVSSVIDSSNPFYPSTSTPVTITITCTNGTVNASDTVVVQLVGSTSTPSIDVKANGSDGPITLIPGGTYTLSWVSLNSTSCQMNPAIVSGMSLIGSSAPIDSSNPFYPSTTTPITITVSCTDGVTTASDSVTINLANIGTTTTPIVDIKANGSDGPITLMTGDVYILSWTSTNSTACQMSPSVVSGIGLVGTSSPIASGNPFYPSTSTPVTITITCTNGTVNASDTVVIDLAITPPPSPVTPPSGGGGGGGSGRRHSSPPPSIPFACPLVNDYMRIDFNNDPIEVMKLQSFLKVYMGYDAVTINGVFDQATYDAVGNFQDKYKDEILTPWGETAPTHYAYILTLKKVNEIYCGNNVAITPEQQHEIDVYRALLQSGGGVGLPIVGYQTSTSTEVLTALVPITSTSTLAIAEPINKGQNLRNLASAILTTPDSLRDKLQCLYEFALILSVLYLLGAILKNVLYTDTSENVLKRFIVGWSTLVLGLLGAIAASYILNEYCLILPLIVVLIFSVAWVIFSPKGNVSTIEGSTIVIEESKIDEKEEIF